MEKNLKIIAGGVFLVLIWAFWCLLFLDKGLDFTDEGYISSEAWRVFMGDELFEDTLAAYGMNPLLLSLIFHVFPDCGLMGLRIIWAVIILTDAFLTAAILLRYFKPFKAFAGTSAGMLLSTCGIVTIPSYNSLAIPLVLLSVLLWLCSFSLRRGPFNHLIAGLAGIVLAAAVPIRITLIFAFIMPFLSVLVDYSSGMDVRHECRRAGIFILFFFLGLAVYGFFLERAGLLVLMVERISVESRAVEHDSLSLVKNLTISLLYFLLGALVIVIPVLVFRISRLFLWVKKYWKTIFLVSLPVFTAIFLIFLVFRSNKVVDALILSVNTAVDLEPVNSIGVYGLFYYITIIGVLFLFLNRRETWKFLVEHFIKSRKIAGIAYGMAGIALLSMWLFFLFHFTNFLIRVFQTNRYFSFNYSGRWLETGIILGILIVCMVINFPWKNRNAADFDKGISLLSAISLFISVIGMVGTNNVPAFANFINVPLLPVSLCGCLLFSAVDNFSSRFTSLGLKRKLMVFFVILFIVSILGFTYMSNRFPYRSSHVFLQTEKLEMGRLKGVYTTPARADILKNIGAKVERYSGKNDRILAMESVPLLYFAFDRLPATRMTWAELYDSESNSRKDIENFRLKQRKPVLVIRFMYSTRNNVWPDMKLPPERKTDNGIMDKYIDDNYFLLEESEGVRFLVPNEKKPN